MARGQCSPSCSPQSYLGPWPVALSQQASSSTSRLEILIWRRLYLEALRGVIVMWRGAGRAEAGRTGPTVNWRGLTPTEHLRNWAAGGVLPSSAVRSFSSVSATAASGTIHKSPYFFLYFYSLPSHDSVSTSLLRVTRAIAKCVCVHVCVHTCTWRQLELPIWGAVKKESLSSTDSSTVVQHGCRTAGQ